MSNDLVAYANVEVQLQIRAGGPYGSEWSIAEIEKDAKRAAEEMVRKLFESTKGAVRMLENTEMKVVTTLVRRG